MPRAKKLLIADLSIAELRRLLAVKERTAALEAKKAKLLSDLAKVEANLEKAAKGVSRMPTRRARKKTRRPRAATPVKKAGSRGRKVAAAGRPTLQGVVANLIRKHGGPLTFQEILGTIQREKLVKTKSRDFANVLRRTLSTSKTIKRVARGTYSVR